MQRNIYVHVHTGIYLVVAKHLRAKDRVGIVWILAECLQRRQNMHGKLIQSDATISSSLQSDDKAVRVQIPKP